MATVDDATLLEVRRPIARAAGLHTIVQGRYGEVGNFELIVPDSDDGLWVYWRNNDQHDVRPGAVAGGWSAGLRFARGVAYDAASVLQTRHGPANLEVLAVSSGALHRIFWNETSGFSAPEQIAVPLTTGAALFEDTLAPHDLVVASVDAKGAGLFRGDVTTYPEVRWIEQPRPVLDLSRDESARLANTVRTGVGVSAVQAEGRTWVATSVHGAVVVFQADAERVSVDRLSIGACANTALLAPSAETERLELLVGDDRGGLLSIEHVAGTGWGRAHRFGEELGRVNAIAACRSTLGGGRIEIVARTGQTLRHGAARRDGSGRVSCTEFSAIETHAWLPRESFDESNQG